MADSLNPWIQGYLNGVAQQHGANYTKAKRIKDFKVQLIKFLNLESRHEDGAVWARVSDKKFWMPVMFTPAAIAAYVKKHKGPSSFLKLSTALVTLQEADLAFRPIPTGDKIGITDDYYLYLDCRSFSISEQHQNDKIWRKPEDIMKDAKIKTYVEGLRRDGGGGNVYLVKKTQSQTRAMNNKFQDDFNALPSPQNGQQPKSPKKTAREDPFWKDLNETNWNIKLQRAQATPSLSDSEEQMRIVTPAKRKSEHANASTDRTESSSQDDDSSSDASSCDSSVSQPSQPLTENWFPTPEKHSPVEADEDSSPTSSPSQKRPRSTAPLRATSARPRQPVLLSSPPAGTFHISDDEEEEQEVATSLSSPGRPILSSKFPGINSRNIAEAGPSKPGTPIPLVPKKSPFPRPSSPGSQENDYIKSRPFARPARVAVRKVPLPKTRSSDSHQPGKSPKILVPNSDTSGIASQSQHLSTQESQPQPMWPPFLSQVQFSQLPQSSQRQNQQRRSSPSQASQRVPKSVSLHGSLSVSNQAPITQDKSPSPQMSRSSPSRIRPSSPHDPLFSQYPNEDVRLQRHIQVEGRVSPTSDVGQTGPQLREKFRAIKTASQGEPPSFGDSEEDDGDSLFSGDGDIALSSDSPQSDGEASDFPAADGDSISVNLPGTQRDMDVDDGDEASRASSPRPEVDMDVEESSDSDVHMEEADQNDKIRDTVMKDAADDTASPSPSHLSQPKALSEDDRQVNDDLFGDSGSHIGKAEEQYVLRSPRPPDENHVANQKEALEHNREAWEQPTFMRQNIIGPSQSINPEQTSDAHPDESDLPAHKTTTARNGRSSVAGRDNQMDGGKTKRRSEADRINALKTTQHPSGDIPSPSQVLEGSKLKGYTVNLPEKLKPNRMVDWKGLHAGLLVFGRARAHELRQNKEE